MATANPFYQRWIPVFLLVGSLVLTIVMIVGSFVTYAQPISSTDMQNIYINRIIWFGAAIFILQMMSLVLVLLENRLRFVEGQSDHVQ